MGTFTLGTESRLNYGGKGIGHFCQTGILPTQAFSEWEKED